LYLGHYPGFGKIAGHIFGADDVAILVNLQEEREGNFKKSKRALASTGK
jgi:hypothetical protein